MSSLIDSSARYLINALQKTRPGVADMVRFRGTQVSCWRCGSHLETYYCEEGVFAVRCCNRVCAGVFLIKSNNPEHAAEEINGIREARKC